MTFDDAELLREFVVESQEHLSDVENQLLSLESQGDAMDVSLVNTVFRAVHSIKGAAGFMGLDTLQSLAHREEEVLNKLRNNELRPTSVVINTLLRASDRLKSLLDNIESSNEEDVTDHIVALERILSGESMIKVTEVSSVQSQNAVPFNSSDSGLCSETLHEFLVESHDNLEQLERDLLQLEKQNDAAETINSAFRNIHTIKGTSGFLGFNKLEKITHSAENLLGCIRDGELAMDDEIGNALFTMIDAVRCHLNSIEQTGCEHSSDQSDLIQHSASLLLDKTSGTNKRKKAAPKRARSPKVTSAKTKAKPATSTVAKPLVEMTEKVSEANLSIQKPLVAPHAAPEKAAPPQIKSLSEATVPSASSVLESASAKAATNDQNAADSTIRVDVALLDKLMTCVGELVLARNQILQYSGGRSDSELHATSQRLNLITTELQEGVMKTRMQPIGNVWAKFPRLVRDLAAICEKQVRIEMEGKETELDKTIIEAIKDPLTHLVRNTVDHGIERAEVRLANGKLAEGCLTLRAYHEGGQVNIEICDDGAGLNVDRIKAKAVERGLMTQDQVSKMADRDVGNLIFLPGFSTAEKVSNVSGRGVGMDVVKTNIEKIGGTVDLQSKQGHGTTIKIKIPLTLAIIPALIVACDNYRYAIPQVNLLELLRLDGDEFERNIEWIQSAPVYRLRGRLLPLVYLRDQLKLMKETQVEALNIVVLRADDRQFGLIVDRINDTEEIVVKPLSSQLKNIPVYSGTTIMGDGQVALILDVMGLAQSANVISDVSKSGKQDHHEHSQLTNQDHQTLLVAGIGASNRVAVQLAQVTRLEKIESQTIEIADGREVVQYRGEIISLIRLNDIMGIPSSRSSEDPLLDVIVYSNTDRTVGIVVDRIIDIVKQSIDIRTDNQSNGRSTSAVIQGRVTDLIDLPAIMNQF